MELENEKYDLGPQQDNKDDIVCHCPCQAQIARLNAEINALKNTLENSTDDNAEQPEAKKPRLQIDADCSPKKTEAKGGISAADLLLNDVVMRHIGSYLSVRDLLDCRVVCKAWNSAASVTLQTRSTYVKAGITDIQSLIVSAESNPQFPFLGFEWSGYCEENEEVTNFLGQFSHMFNRLHLKFPLSKPSIATRVADLLATYFSHVEVLDMTETSCYMRRPDPTVEFRLLRSNMEQVFLPELKLLILPCVAQDYASVQPFFRDLLNAAPNLRKIEGFDPSLTTAVNSAGKMHIISRMTFIGDDIAPFTSVAVTPPCHLSHLVMHVDISSWRDNADLQTTMWDAFVAIMVANRETLKNLTMMDLGSQITNLPAFPRLTDLHIRFRRRCAGNYRLFPEDVPTMFPALNSVKVEHMDGGSRDFDGTKKDHVLREYLWDEPLSSVKRLNISFPLNKDVIVYLETIFPNVTELSIDWQKCFPYTRNFPMYDKEEEWDLWKARFPLRRLEIHRFNRWADEQFSLDSFLTGIPEIICRNLRLKDFSELPMDSYYYNSLRAYPSLLDLKSSLQELIIFFDFDEDDYEKSYPRIEVNHNVTVSSVSYAYVIKLMNDLRVYFTYDHRKRNSSIVKSLLAPMETHVTVLHQESTELRYS